jgi:hypothetical protein
MSLWHAQPALVSVWTAHDTAEAGPTVDDEDATVTVAPGDGSAPVLHIATDGASGLWTIAVTLTPDSVAALARDLEATR